MENTSLLLAILGLSVLFVFLMIALPTGRGSEVHYVVVPEEKTTQDGCLLSLAFLLGVALTLASLALLLS